MSQEAAIVAELLVRLGARPDLTVWRNNTGALPRQGGGFVAFGLRGSSDILGLATPGWLVAVEVKGPKGKRTAQQEAFARMVRRHGGIYVLADRGADEAVRALDDALAVRRRDGGA